MTESFVRDGRLDDERYPRPARRLFSGMCVNVALSSIDQAARREQREREREREREKTTVAFPSVTISIHEASRSQDAHRVLPRALRVIMCRRAEGLPGAKVVKPGHPAF